MPVPVFGFSLGDFIAGIGLLIDIFHGLNSTSGAPADYKELWRELKNLKSSLEGVRNLSLDPSYPPQASAASSAIAFAVNDCLSCADGFMQMNKKYSSLGSTPANRWSSAGFKNSWRMVQWAIWKKAEVIKFKGEVQHHVAAIQMLLAELQIHQSSAQAKLLATSVQQTLELHKSLQQSSTADHRETRDQIQLHGKSQETSLKELDQKIVQVQADVQHNDNQLEVLLALERSMAGGETPYQQDLLHRLLLIAAHSQRVMTHNQTLISSQNIIIKNQQDMLAELRDLATIVRVNQAIPAQVLLSTPVILLDALGRRAPFHTEFIDSAEAFIAVLKVRFKDIGLHKIEKGQFEIEDTTRGQKLDLSNAWNTIIRPGQHISMMMIFRLQRPLDFHCLSSRYKNEGWEETEIERAFFALLLANCCFEETSSWQDDQSDEDTVSSSQSSYVRDMAGTKPKRKARRADDVDNTVEDEITQYTQVNIWILSHVPLAVIRERLKTKAKKNSFNIIGMEDGVKSLALRLEEGPGA